MVPPPDKKVRLDQANPNGLKRTQAEEPSDLEGPEDALFSLESALAASSKDLGSQIEEFSKVRWVTLEFG